MGELRDRYLELHVGTRIIRGAVKPGLRVSFKATKSLTKEPNTLDVQIYNLAPDTRAALSKERTPVVSLVAGYKDDRTSIFYGQTLHVSHERRDADIITTVSTTDGGDKTQKARIKQSFGPRTKAGDVLRALVKALDLKPGNLDQAVRELNAGRAASLYTRGVTLSGAAPAALDSLCRSAGLEWSIQDGALQILNAGKATSSTAIVLKPGVLLSTPAISAKGIVTARTFLQQDFLPGRQVQIQHEFVNGAFRVEKCNYEGDTHSDVWAVEFEAKGPKK